MKTIIFFAAMFFSVVISGQAKISFEGASSQFNLPKFDWGKVKVIDGATFKSEIRFTNTGNFPLIISNIQSPVDNMVAYWPQDPVKPGESGIITVSIIARISEHPYRKCLYVISNAENETHREIIQIEVLFTE